MSMGAADTKTLTSSIRPRPGDSFIPTIRICSTHFGKVLSIIENFDSSARRLFDSRTIAASDSDEWDAVYGFGKPDGWSYLRTISCALIGISASKSTTHLTDSYIIDADLLGQYLTRKDCRSKNRMFNLMAHVLAPRERRSLAWFHSPRKRKNALLLSHEGVFNSVTSYRDFFCF